MKEKEFGRNNLKRKKFSAKNQILGYFFIGKSIILIQNNNIF